MRVYRLARPFTDEEKAEMETRWSPFEGEYAAPRYSKYAGLGWMHGPHCAIGTSGAWNYSMPTPEVDKPSHTLSSDEVCGTASVDKLLDWFETAIPIMVAEGFRLLTLYVPFRKVVVQSQQVCFRWADARIIHNDPVSALLPLCHARGRAAEEARLAEIRATLEAAAPGRETWDHIFPETIIGRRECVTA